MFGYDWPRFHAAVNDFPAALLVATVLFDLGALIWKRESLKWASIWTLWLGVIGGWIAVLAGERASDIIEHGEAIHELMESHETWAIVTMSIFTVVLVWKLWRRFNEGRAESWLIRGITLFGLAILVRTGMLGGQLVFEHAAGIPKATMESEIKNREAGHHHGPGEEDHDHDHDAGTDSAHAEH
ncbi:MAG TPA: DUF2231 domain-containing protein [Gemmatimonadales bacterium]|nr:DUF2231 domain-containing protein [Gemmatimonadales bacterium]